MSKGYNGYANYETWNIVLWLQNNEGDYNTWTERAEAAVQDSTEDGKDDEQIKQDAVTLIADHLKQEIGNDNMPELHGTYADLLNAALGEVDWDEVAHVFVDDVEIERE